MSWYRFSENNSGGSWWLSDDDYIKLVSQGAWKLSKYYASNTDTFLADKNQRIPRGFRSGLIGEFDSYEYAVASWQSATGQDIDEQGCTCCGSPFYLSEQTIDSSDLPLLSFVGANSVDEIIRIMTAANSVE